MQGILGPWVCEVIKSALSHIQADLGPSFSSAKNFLWAVSRGYFSSLQLHFYSVKWASSSLMPLYEDNIWCCLVAQSCLPFLWPPWTVAHLVSLSVRFPRQGYWSGLPLPTPGDLPDPGIEPTSTVAPVLAGRFFTSQPPGKSPLLGWWDSNEVNE